MNIKGVLYGIAAALEGLRQEVKPYNIRTTVISPGAVATELLEHISENPSAQLGRIPLMSDRRFSIR